MLNAECMGSLTHLCSGSFLPLFDGSVFRSVSPTPHPNCDLDDNNSVVVPQHGGHSNHSSQVFIVVVEGHQDDAEDLELLYLLPRKLSMQVLISTKLFSKNSLISSSKSRMERHCFCDSCFPSFNY